MPFLIKVSVCTMSSSNTEAVAPQDFFNLGTRMALLRDYQLKLRWAGKNNCDMTRDLELIKLETSLSFGSKSYNTGLSEYLHFTDAILKESIARVEELHKLVEK